MPKDKVHREEFGEFSVEQPKGQLQNGLTTSLKHCHQFGYVIVLLKSLE